MILLHASIGDGWQEIGNGVIEGLHLDQKTVLVEWNASCVGSELGQDLGICGVGKLAPVHLDQKFLEIVPSFEHGSPGGQTTHHNGILEDTAGNHARHHHQQGQPTKERLAKLKDAVHVTLTPPLAMVEGIERIQGMQHVGLQWQGGCLQARSFQKRNGFWAHGGILLSLHDDFLI